jgi:hypothetical protein
MSSKEISRTDRSDQQNLTAIDTAPANATAKPNGVGSAKKRASFPHDGRGGIVHDRPYPPPSERPRSAVAPAATPHPVKFSGSGDAVNAHADADHGTILERHRSEFAGFRVPAGLSPIHQLLLRQ